MARCVLLAVVAVSGLVRWRCTGWVVAGPSAGPRPGRARLPPGPTIAATASWPSPVLGRPPRRPRYSSPSSWALGSVSQSSSSPASSSSAAFASLRDDDGGVNFESFIAFEEISALVGDGLLEEREVDEIWMGVLGSRESKADEAAFMKIYSIVDGLFEDDEGGGEEEEEAEKKGAFAETSPTSALSSLETMTATREEDLKLAFDTLTRLAKGPSLSKRDIMQWMEVRELLSEGLTSETEVGAIFDASQKIPGSPDRIGFEGFIELGLALDSLFEDVEDDDEDFVPAKGGKESSASTITAGADDSGTDKTVQELQPESSRLAEMQEEFSLLIGDEKTTLSLEDMMKWDEVAELIAEGELDASEVKEIWSAIPKSETPGRIDFKGFLAFNEKLDGLFVFEDEIEVEGEEEKVSSKRDSGKGLSPEDLEAAAKDAKAELNDLLAKLEKSDVLGGEKLMRQQIVGAVDRLVAACGEVPATSLLSNVVSRGRAATLAGVVGDWELVYSTSSALEFHSGLTGLGTTLPGASFVGLRQSLTNTDGVFDGIYEEELEVGGKPLPVTVTADWELRETTSIVTNEAALSLEVFTQRVKYGFIDVIGERWKALRSMRLLDILYMSDDLRIMRGQTSNNTIFVWKRL